MIPDHCCILTAVVNVMSQGDSGFVVVRDGKVIARSRALQHHFDCPLQLGAYPDYVEITDTAEQADMYNIDVQPGDVIVAGARDAD